MKVIQWLWTEEAGWQQLKSGNEAFTARFVLFLALPLLRSAPDRANVCRKVVSRSGKERFGDSAAFAARGETPDA